MRIKNKYNSHPYNLLSFGGFSFGGGGMGSDGQGMAQAAIAAGAQATLLATNKYWENRALERLDELNEALKLLEDFNKGIYNLFNLLLNKNVRLLQFDAFQNKLNLEKLLLAQLQNRFDLGGPFNMGSLFFNTQLTPPSSTVSNWQPGGFLPDTNLYTFNTSIPNTLTQSYDMMAPYRLSFGLSNILLTGLVKPDAQIAPTTAGSGLGGMIGSIIGASLTVLQSISSLASPYKNKNADIADAIDATGVTGALIRGIKGIKTDEAKLAKAQGNINTTNLLATSASAATSLEDASLQYSIPSLGTFESPYSASKIASKKTRDKVDRKNKELQAKLIIAENLANRSQDTSIHNIERNNLNMALANYSAFGGPIDTTSPIGYYFMNDYLNTLLQQANLDTFSLIPTYSNISSSFADGGKINTTDINMGDELDLTPKEIALLKRLGYKIEII